MRTTETLTYLPATSYGQADVKNPKGGKPRELLREAWRQYLDTRYGTYSPTKAGLFPPALPSSPKRQAADKMSTHCVRLCHC